MFVRRAAAAFALLAITAAAHAGVAAEPPPQSAFALEEKPDRLIITDGGRPVAEYVFIDPEVKRPYFRHVHTPAGIQVTRNHPPVEGRDLADHPTMHPGIWWGFGDVNGEDFWRNQGTMRHERFSIMPRATRSRVEFQHDCLLVTAAGEELGRAMFYVRITRDEVGYLFLMGVKLATLGDKELFLGDQEEMGLGVRLASPLAEKNGGRVTGGDGLSGAKAVWGTQSRWCDYSGTLDGRKVGVTTWNHNPVDRWRSTWWHVRDYGLMVANCFGKRAGLEVPRTKITHNVIPSFSYTIIVHDSPDYDPKSAIERLGSMNR